MANSQSDTIYSVHDSQGRHVTDMHGPKGLEPQSVLDALTKSQACSTLFRRPGESTPTFNLRIWAGSVKIRPRVVTTAC